MRLRTGGIEASRRRALDSVRRSIAIVERVIASNDRLAQIPGYEEGADRRILEGQAELLTLRDEEARLKAAVEYDEANV